MGADGTVVFIDPMLLQRLEKSSEFRVASMPVENLTADPSAPKIFRDHSVAVLKTKGYTPIDPAQIDATLLKLGVTHAGQLGLVSIDQLSKQLPADGYLFSSIDQASIRHTIVYNAYSYSSSVELRDRSGRIIWAAQDRIAKRRIALNPTNALLDTVSIRRKGKMENSIKALADLMLASLPVGPIQVKQVDNLLDQAEEIKAVIK